MEGVIAEIDMIGLALDDLEGSLFQRMIDQGVPQHIARGFARELAKSPGIIEAARKSAN